MYGLKLWDKLPPYLKTKEVKPYYRILEKKRTSLAAKRIFDFTAAFFLLIVLLPVFAVLAVWIKLDSPGPVFFRQVRITQYGRRFWILKFRTMVSGAQQKGADVTVRGDARITRVGKKIRSCRLDELPQLVNILMGDMSFVGTRPEVEKYVRSYSREMMATLLLPAGVTSEASIAFRDEERLLEHAEDVDRAYVETVLPQKMKYNLSYLKRFSCFRDLKICLDTVMEVGGRREADPQGKEGGTCA